MPEVKDHNSIKFNSSNSTQYIIFELNNKSYGINIDDVREVLNYIPPTEIPLATENISGIINIRGNIIPIIDLNYRLYNKKSDFKKENIIIIETSHDGQTIQIGALIDKIVSVVKISNKDISQDIDLGADINNTFIENICRYQKDFMLALNTDKVFDIEELAKNEGLNIDYSEAISSEEKQDYHSAESIAEKKDSTVFVKYIYFNVANEKYALEMNKISEIIKVPEIIPVANTLPFMLGVVSLRNHVIPVVDMRQRCGLPQTEHTRQTAIPIIETQGKLVGLLVDEVLNINSIDQKTINQTIDYSLQIDRNFVSGMFKDGEEIIVAINEEKILSNEQFESISKDIAEKSENNDLSNKDNNIKSENKPKAQKKRITKKSSKKNKTTDENNLKNTNN